jgi:hypothetical protein
MKALACRAAACIGIGLSVLLSACGGGGNHLTLPPATYVLTVNSTNPSSGVAITVSPSDVNNAGNGTTSFTRTYTTGTTVTLTAPATASGNPFSSWSGCTSASTVTCTVTMSSTTTVTANYTASAITSVTVAPNPATATIGLAGNGRTVTAKTDYLVSGVDIKLSCSGGNGVRITEKAGVHGPIIQTFSSCSAMGTLFLWVGEAVNFGAFSAAPMVTVWGD